jgi:hypothetical protein
LFLSFLFCLFFKNLHFKYENFEQLWEEVVTEHWDNFLSSSLHAILPENILSFKSGDGAAFSTSEFASL